MNVFDRQHYRINKSIFTFMGQWPLQTSGIRYFSTALICMLGGTNIIVKLIATAKLGNDINGILQDIPPIICDLMAGIKIVNNTLQRKKMIVIFNRIQVDYLSITSDGELKIMYEYANNGRKFTIMYLALYFVTMLGSMIPPLQEIIISYRNESSERVYLHHTEYFVDPADYYFPIIFHSYITIFLVVYLIVSTDTLFVVIAQHACGLFKVLGYSLDQISNNIEELVQSYPSKEKDESFKSISLCVRKHQKAIEFVDLMDSYYSGAFFVQAAINMFGVSVAGLIVLQFTEGKEDLFRVGSILFTAIAHIFFECASGQRIIDHSSKVNEDLTNVKWYHTSFRTKNIFNLMVLRSQTPCALTAAGMFDMSMETFSSILRTSMSYFTVLKSTQ